MTLMLLLEQLTEHLGTIDNEEKKIEALNVIKQCLHDHSPFRQEPVDCVIWVKAEYLDANDYNPNVMAPAEKKLLKRSLEQDGFTQPVVVSEKQGRCLVVDGFHRYLLGQDKQGTGKRLRGYLPVARINPECQGEAERIAATIRHNRARGKHLTASMSDIVRDLSRLGWDDRRMGLELGMEADEVLRLRQISGLAELFLDEEYSEAWTVL